MESLDTPLHNPDYAEISINSKSEIIPEVETDSGDKSDVEDQSKKPRKFLGSTLEEVANVPKVKLQISSAPLPPVQEFPELPYGRRKKRRPGEENQENWIKVPLILSAKRIHPGTKQNNLLLEPLTEIKDQIEETDEKPNIDKVPKYRRKRRTVTAVTNDLQTTETTNNDIFSAPNESHDDTILDNLTKVFDDNDDGFTTIKDLAERGITKMEPLDYGDDPYLDECYNEEFAGFEEENQSNFKHESGDQEQSQFDLDNVKNEPEIESKEKSAEKDGGDVDSIKSEPKESRNRKCKTKLRQSKQTISDDDVFNNEDLDDILFRHQDDEVLDVEDRPLKPPKKAKRKPRSKPAPGYGPAPDRKVYNCKYCEYNGKKLEWLAHLKSAHSDKNLVFCKLKKCQQPFESPELLDEHEQNTHIKNVCTFEGCGKEFKFKSVLREHRKTHFPADCDWMADPDPEMTLDRFFVCTFCGRRYRTRTGWRAHEAYVHTKQLNFKCDEPGCDKAYLCENDLVVHKRKHSGELPFTCSYCGNRYISAHSLAQHEKAAHLQTEDVECEVCNKKVRKRNLPAHVKTHSEFKGLPCKFCNKEYPTSGSLRRHEKIHTDCKEHKCRFCGKSFVQKANMQAHERIHTGERPYKCQYCNDGFVQLTRKKQHESTCKLK